ncbi:MAG TPA: hypothetical protein VJ063_21315 [Verrucomicrobiae bacterium]|nr:hypothetical protein [Verrucomicrobiae bacterium]
MHVRGSSLSHPKVIEALRPFIVAFWGQANDEAIPKDIQPLYDASGRRSGSNVRCFVLDRQGKLLHSFNGFPGNNPNPMRYSTDEYAAYFCDEINQAALPLKIKLRDTELKLPDVKNGVRLFIRLPEHRGSYGAPVIEVVENKGEWATLEYPKTPREIDAQSLSRWLRLCYPPGVNEQLEPYQSIQGTLSLKPAGEHQAILSGKIRLGMSDSENAPFDGTFDGLLTYQRDKVSMRGVVSGVYRRHDHMHDREMHWKLTAAIESRPD